MKKLIISLILIGILSLCGCASKTQPGGSSKAQPPVSSEESVIEAVSFKDDDRFIEYKNNIRYTDSGIYYSFVNVDGDDIYMTLPSDTNGNYALCKISRDGNKEKIADNAWGAFPHGQDIYFVKWAGDTASPYSLALKGRDGEKTLASDIYGVFFGDKGVYYTKDEKLFLLEYGAGEAKKVYESPKESETGADWFEAYFYNNHLYVNQYTGLYRFEGNGENKENAGRITSGTIITFRNNNVYHFDYVNDSSITKLERYDLRTGKNTEFTDTPTFFTDYGAVNFTDNYCVFSNAGGVFRTDPAFKEKELIFGTDDDSLWLAVSDNKIFVRYFDSKTSQEKNVQIDEDGNIIKEY